MFIYVYEIQQHSNSGSDTLFGQLPYFANKEYRYRSDDSNALVEENISPTESNESNGAGTTDLILNGSI